MSLMNEGAGELDATAFANRADDISARLGFGSGRDSASVSARVPDRDAGRGRRPAGDGAEPIRASTPSRWRACAGRSCRASPRTTTDPDAIASKAWFAEAYPNDPYGIPQSGTRETVQSITVDDLRAAKDRLLTRANAKIAVVGDIGPERAGEMIDELMAGLPKGEAEPVEQTDNVPPPGVTVIDQDVPQSVAVFGRTGVPRDDPDFFPAYVMNYILGGGGLTSRLTEEVREKRGLAYSVYSYLADLDAADLYMGGVQTANERIAESLDVIRKEWAKMAENGVTAGRAGEGQDLPDGLVPAALRLERQDRQLSGLRADGGPGRRLHQQAQRPDRGGDAGGRAAGGEAAAGPGDSCPSSWSASRSASDPACAERNRCPGPGRGIFVRDTAGWFARRHAVVLGQAFLSISLRTQPRADS